MEYFQNASTFCINVSFPVYAHYLLSYLVRTRFPTRANGKWALVTLQEIKIRNFVAEWLVKAADNRLSWFSDGRQVVSVTSWIRNRLMRCTLSDRYSWVNTRSTFGGFYCNVITIITHKWTLYIKFSLKTTFRIIMMKKNERSEFAVCAIWCHLFIHKIIIIHPRSPLLYYVFCIFIYTSSII